MSTGQHTIAFNGAAHHDTDCEQCRKNRRATHAAVVADWHGHAVCGCGTMSPHLTRNHERREWHGEHVSK
jgi:hypothetical protein